MTSRGRWFGGVATGLAVFIGAVSAQSSPRRTVYDGVYSEAQALRGKQAYIEHCASCHGEGLQGADLAPRLKGENFLLKWSAQPIHGLASMIVKEMPANAPGALSAQMYADITAYMLQVNKFPAGKDDLPSDDAGLKAIELTYDVSPGR